MLFSLILILLVGLRHRGIMGSTVFFTKKRPGKDDPWLIRAAQSSWLDHNLRPVRSISDRVIALAFGRKIAEGSHREVSGNPCVVEACFGSRRHILKGSSAPF
jgi:hypothetical protein